MCQNIVFKMCGYKNSRFRQAVSNNATGIKLFRLKALKL